MCVRVCVCGVWCVCVRKQHVTTQASSDDNETNNDAPVLLSSSILPTAEKPKPHPSPLRLPRERATVRLYEAACPDLWPRPGRGLVGTGGEL
jgi:hypothetical protein